MRSCSGHHPVETSRLILKNGLVPQHYRVRLTPDLEKFVYDGEVEVKLTAETATNKVQLNILDINIHKAWLNGEEASSAEEDKDLQAIEWTFASTIEKGQEATLKVQFDGTLNDQLAGFYRSVHKDKDGNQKVVATTQMEPTDCRRAFPCFDEPSLKATFDIELVADKHLTALSNSDVKSEETLENGQVLTKFNTTPKMSTYLVAFVVGELEYVESKDFRLPIRVYATPGLAARCQFSADLAAKTLAFFESKFGIEYPLPKLDMIAIHDFSAGAMENWGLITYRNVDLFFEEGKDNAATKIRVAEVVQHELAHQWFGNLVTMDWWDGLWLNEGFATWMSWYSCANFFPEWKVWESYISSAYQGCLGLDGLRASHPVQVPVKRADEISQIFDAISYLKGSCIIRMVSQVLGEQTFIKGIAHYLKRHQYGNTTTDDLWNALSEVSGQDVKAIMDVWTREMGYPILTVEEKEQVLRIRQNRYLRQGDVKPEEDETLYPVWLGLRTGNGEIKATEPLTGRETSVEYDGDFYKLNADQNGIFRVQYPDARLEKLAAEGSKPDTRLSVTDRVGLVFDVAAQAGAYAKTSQLLTLIDAWKHETQLTVWEAILPKLSEIRAIHMQEPQEVVDAINRLRETIYVGKADELGHEFAESDTFQDEKLKAMLFSGATRIGNQKYVDSALALYAQGFRNINPNLRPAVFAAVGEYGSPEQWEELLAIYKDDSNGIASNDALSALGGTKDVALKKRVLAHVLDGTIRTQNATLALMGVASDKDGIALAFDWLRANYDAIALKFPPALGMLSGVIQVCTRSLTTQEQLNEYLAFFDGRDLKGIHQAYNIVKDSITNNIAWLEKDREDIKQWLAAHKYL